MIEAPIPESMTRAMIGAGAELKITVKARGPIKLADIPQAELATAIIINGRVVKDRNGTMPWRPAWWRRWFG